MKLHIFVAAMPDTFLSAADACLLPVTPFFILDTLAKPVSMVGLAYFLRGSGIFISTTVMGRATNILGFKNILLVTSLFQFLFPSKLNIRWRVWSEN